MIRFRGDVNIIINFENPHKTIPFFVSVLLILATLIGGCISSDYPSHNPITPAPVKEYLKFNSTFDKYSANIEIEQIPESILLYKAEKSDYSKDWASSLAKRLGLSGKMSEYQSGFMNEDFERNARSLTINSDSGIISFNSDMFRRDNFPDKDKPQNLPPDDLVLMNVTVFLQSQNLLFPDAEYAGMAHSGTEHINESNKKEVIRQTKSVFYQRILNGRKVLNSKIMVVEGEDFDIIYLGVHWRNYTPFIKVPVKPVETAFREFATKELWCTKISGIPDKVEVLNLTLAYYSQVPAAAESEKYLQPVYVFESHAQKGNISSTCSPVYIPATTEQFDSIPGCNYGV